MLALALPRLDLIAITSQLLPTTSMRSSPLRTAPSACGPQSLLGYSLKNISKLTFLNFIRQAVSHFMLLKLCSIVDTVGLVLPSSNKGRASARFARYGHRYAKSIKACPMLQGLQIAGLFYAYVPPCLE
jgi:hypothetical protein